MYLSYPRVTVPHCSHKLLQHPYLQPHPHVSTYTTSAWSFIDHWQTGGESSDKMCCNPQLYHVLLNILLQFMHNIKPAWQSCSICKCYSTTLSPDVGSGNEPQVSIIQFCTSYFFIFNTIWWDNSSKWLCTKSVSLMSGLRKADVTVW